MIEDIGVVVVQGKGLQLGQVFFTVNGFDMVKIMTVVPLKCTDPFMLQSQHDLSLSTDDDCLSHWREMSAFSKSVRKAQAQF